MNVVIFGCGPAGLLAAHAAAQAQLDFVIYSRKQKSVMPGAQFLHTRIEGITGDQPDNDALFIKVGPKEGYAAKVYGRRDAPCSWEEYGAGFHPIWNMGAAYDRLWDLYSDSIIDCDLDHLTISELRNNYKRDLIVSTVPAPLLCVAPDRHRFDSSRVWIRSERLPSDIRLTDTITYNGLPEVAWYRQSILFGWRSWEFGHPVPRAAEGRKPLGTNCDCCPDIARLGRFGTWRKGVLIHHAYKGAQRLILDSVERRGRFGRIHAL